MRAHSNIAPLLTLLCCIGSVVTGCDNTGSDASTLAKHAGVQLSGEEIIQTFSNVKDSAAIQDEQNTTANNLWFADGRFVNHWRNAEQSGTVRGRWSVQRGERCVLIESGLQGVIGEQRCGPIVKEQVGDESEYLSFNADGSVHARHTLTSMTAAEIAQGAAATTDDSTNSLGSAYQNLLQSLSAAEQTIRQEPAFESDAEKVGAYRHLLRSFIKGIEAEVFQDPDFPYFRILDFWLREGGDNPDQRYAFSPVRGGETYRVWGTLGSAARLELQLYAGRPWDGSGKSAGFLTFEEIDLAADGSFEIWVSAEQRAGNWLANPADATTLFARHIYADWNAEATGDIHIDRVGFEGKRKPAESLNALADKLQAASVMFSTTAKTWPQFVQKRYVQDRPVNTVSIPYDTYALGGAKGRWMGGGHFELKDGEALVLRIPATESQYQAVQLADLWFASLDHDNQVSSLTSKQSVMASDKAYHYVISQQDPGYANWLDSGALARGVFLLRWDGHKGAIPDSQFPSAQLTNLDKLAEIIPGFSRVSEAERSETRQKRRQHLQLRSHR